MVLSFLQRRPKTFLVAFTASLLIVVVGLQVVHLWLARQRILALAEQRAGNLATALSQYVRGSLAVFDTSLAQLAIHGRRVGGAGASKEDWNPILSAALASLGVSGSLTVADADGLIRHSTLARIIGQSRRENYVFKELARLDRDDLVVDRPYMSITEPKQFVIPLGRRLTKNDGTFDGAVVATLLPEGYRQFFRTIQIGPHGAIWVFHPDGVILFREPSTTNPINVPADHNAIVRAVKVRAEGGTLTGPLEPGGASFISAYRTTGRPPLTVAVSMSRDDVLADWNHEARTSALALAALAFTLAGVVAIACRQIDARAQAKRELAEVQRLEASRLRDANERLAEALEREQRARQESEAASYLKDEFLMTVSHELRTPLNAIYGWVRMLANGDMPPEQRARALATVERNARAQTRLIDDLLDVSRAISGRLRLEARAIEVADAAAAALETLRPALEAKRIVFTSTIEPGLGPIVADPDRLQQILWNLLSNAIKFTPDGGSVSLNIGRAASPDDSTSGDLEIVVSDSGVGIAPTFLPHAFERFRQAEAGTRRRFGGLGLGLAIVRHIVELHGGTVAAESPGEGKGATFRVVLPIRRPQANADSRVHAASAHVGDSTLDGLRVLVVDDERDARDLFASVLERAGARARTAASAAEALHLLRVEGADVLLSDIEMPGEDGYQLLTRALADPGIPPLVALALSAHAGPVDRQRALDAGYHAHFAKPVEPAELVRAVASLAAGEEDASIV